MSSFHPAETEIREVVKLKLAILGDKQVGKTSLVTRFVKGSFSQIYLHTSGGDISEKSIHINGANVHLTIIDSAGHRYVRSLIKSLYRNVHGIMLVYDVTREKTFDSLTEWLKEIASVTIDNPYIVVVGNKRDLVKFQAVKSDRATQFASQHEIPHKEVSAKTGHLVQDAFKALIEGTFREKLYSSEDLNHSIKLSMRDIRIQEAKDEKDQCCS